MTKYRGFSFTLCLIFIGLTSCLNDENRSTIKTGQSKCVDRQGIFSVVGQGCVENCAWHARVNVFEQLISSQRNSPTIVSSSEMMILRLEQFLSRLTINSPDEWTMKIGKKVIRILFAKPLETLKIGGRFPVYRFEGALNKDAINPIKKSIARREKIFMANIDSLKNKLLKVMYGYQDGKNTISEINKVLIDLKKINTEWRKWQDKLDANLKDSKKNAAHKVYYDIEGLDFETLIKASVSDGPKKKKRRVMSSGETGAREKELGPDELKDKIIEAISNNKPVYLSVDNRWLGGTFDASNGHAVMVVAYRPPVSNQEAKFYVKDSALAGGQGSFAWVESDKLIDYTVYATIYSATKRASVSTGKVVDLRDGWLYRGLTDPKTGKMYGEGSIESIDGLEVKQGTWGLVNDHETLTGYGRSIIKATDGKATIREGTWALNEADGELILIGDGRIVELDNGQLKMTTGNWDNPDGFIQANPQPLEYKMYLSFDKWRTE